MTKTNKAICIAVCILAITGTAIILLGNNEDDSSDRQMWQTESETPQIETKTTDANEESNYMPNKGNNAYDKDIVENSYLWSEPFPFWVDAQDEENPNYTFLVDVVSAEGIIEVTELEEIPKTINGYTVEETVGYIADRDLAIVQLKSVTGEIGAWNYITHEYELLFSLEILDEAKSEYWFSVRGFKDGKLLMSSSGIGTVEAASGAILWIYDFETGEIRKIYTYNTKEGSSHNFLHPENFVMVEDGIYFEDSFNTEIGAGYYSNILFYNYEKQEVATEHTFGVNPIKYGDSYACFVGDIATTRYNTLVDRNGNILWEVDEYGSGINGNGKDIFITARANDDEMMVTRTGLRTLDGRYILTTYRVCSIGYVTPKTVLLNTSSLNKDYPFLYDTEMDRILRFDSIPCTNFGFLSASEDGRKMILSVNYDKNTYLLEYK